MNANTAYAHDIGAHIAGYHALDSTSITAGGGGDATAILGRTIHRTALSQIFNSAKAIVPLKAVLAATKTLTVTLKWQHSLDGTTWVDYVYRPSGVDQVPATKVLTGATGGSTEYGVIELNADLDGAYEYIRIYCLPDLSATGTDTAVIGAGVVAFGGGPDLPVVI